MSRYVFEGKKFENCVIFSHPGYGEIRMLVDDDGTKLFAGIDIAACMGYAAPSKAILRCGIEGRIRMVPWVFKKRQGATDTRCFNEEEAKLFIEKGMIPPDGFKEWFVQEILPQANDMKVDRDTKIRKESKAGFADCLNGVQKVPEKPALNVLAELDRIILEILELKRLIGKLEKNT